MIFKSTRGKIYCKDDSYQKLLDSIIEFQRDDNYRLYYKGHLVHRDDGPACEWSDGSKTWYIDGKKHREDGCALEYTNGRREYFIDGIEYSKKEYLKIINLKSKKKTMDNI